MAVDTLIPVRRRCRCTAAGRDDADSEEARRAPGRCSIRRSCGAPLKDSVLKLNPGTLMKNPVIFVVEVGAALMLLFVIRDIVDRHRRHWFRAPDRPLALVHGPVRELRRGDGRSARQGAGRLAAQDQDRHARQADRGRRQHRKGLVVEAARGRRRRLRAPARRSPATAK